MIQTRLREQLAEQENLNAEEQRSQAQRTDPFASSSSVASGKQDLQQPDEGARMRATLQQAQELREQRSLNLQPPPLGQSNEVQLQLQLGQVALNLEQR